MFSAVTKHGIILAYLGDMRLLLMTVLILFVCGQGKAQILTDEDILKLVQEETKGKWNPQARDLCITHPEYFKQITLISTFANDAGCGLEWICLDSTLLKPIEAAKRILPGEGWAKDAAYPEWAETWTREVVAVNKTILDKAPEKWNKGGKAPVFEPLQGRVERDEIVITVWIQQPAGMAPEANFAKLEVRYGISGEYYQSKVVANHRVSLWPPGE